MTAKEHYPRRMTRGLFRGRVFDSQQEYHDALTASYPRTLTKGLLAGRTFSSEQEYKLAVRQLQRRANGEHQQAHLDEDKLVRILEAYDTLLQQGIGRRAAAKIIVNLLT